MATKKEAESQPLPEIGPTTSVASVTLDKQDVEANNEVFGNSESGVNFRTVHWLHASMIFLKTVFATGVLAVPASLYTLGAVPGVICVLIFQMINTYCAIVLGNFRLKHTSCHSIADMAHIIGGPILREIAGVLFLIAYIVCTGSGIVGVSVGLNALSDHAICTNWFSAVATILVALIASVRKFEKIAWFTWAGFVSVFVAILIVVIGVTLQHRPAAAPQEGDFELGFYAVNHASFAATVVALTNIFCASAANSAFVPVISEMKNPYHYKKAVFLCMGVVTAAYLSFSMVVYAWCGQWIASPSLGSGGPLLKKVAYGVGFLGLLISAGLWAHIGAKYIFVRILRNSEHLTKNSLVHWGWWVACVMFMAITSFLVASGVPIFEFIIAIAGSIAFAPLALILPGLFWLYDHAHYWSRGGIKSVAYVANCGLVILGTFITIAGTYAVVQQIIEAYRDGKIGSAFSCADNSNST